MSANYTGFSPDTMHGALQNRFFYGLRRTDNGELFVGKSDQLKNEDSDYNKYSWRPHKELS